MPVPGNSLSVVSGAIARSPQIPHRRLVIFKCFFVGGIQQNVPRHLAHLGRWQANRQHYSRLGLISVSSFCFFPLSKLIK